MFVCLFIVVVLFCFVVVFGWFFFFLGGGGVGLFFLDNKWKSSRVVSNCTHCPHGPSDKLFVISIITSFNTADENL